jgi:hypothetical protein
MSDLKTITYRPGAGEYAWTFGGAAPVMRLRAPCALELYTEDCFAGRVQSADDLVSRLNITGLSRIRGNLTAQGTMVGSSEPGSDLRTVIAAEGAAVDGDIDLRDLHATGGALRFRNAAVGGLVHADGAKLANPGGYTLNLHQAVVKGSVRVGARFRSHGAPAELLDEGADGLGHLIQWYVLE